MRVVCLAPAVTEIVFALGRGGNVVGRTRYCDRPPEVLSVPVVGDYMSPDVEKIVNLKPDVVIVSKGPGNKGGVRKLQKLGINVRVMSLYSVAEILESIKQIGQALDADEQAQTIVRTIEDSLQTARQRAQTRNPVTALLVVGQDPVIVAASGSLPAELLDIAGGRNLAPMVAGKTYVSIEKERLSAIRPQVLIDATLADGSYTEARREALFEMYKALPGWQDIRVEFVTDDAVYLPGANIAAGAGILQKILYAEEP
ncbi:MAG: ABC transporter substrate-binding protein [Planctomycetes bacterium]|nr:ABC transporter substrate-binding protein [Planctomycetota bacterium]